MLLPHERIVPGAPPVLTTRVSPGLSTNEFRHAYTTFRADKPTKLQKVYLAEHCTRLRSPVSPPSISLCAYITSAPRSSLGTGE